MEELINHKAALRREITYLTTRLEDNDTGHIRTTIWVLEQRIKDIQDFIDDIHRKAFEYLNARDKVKHDEAVQAMMTNHFGSI